MPDVFKILKDLELKAVGLDPQSNKMQEGYFVSFPLTFFPNEVLSSPSDLIFLMSSESEEKLVLPVSSIASTSCEELLLIV